MAIERMLQIPRPAFSALALGVSMVCTSFSAYAGDWKITPTIAVSETATDNVALSSSRRQGDLISDVNPGLRIEGSGGRSALRFDYQLHNLFYAQDSTRNTTQNSLNALGTLEALENWLFIEASGLISQQSISAFGGATATNVNTNVNNNTTETSTYRLSPYIRGTLGSAADYQVRYNLSSTNAKSSQTFDSDSRELVASLKGVTGLANLGWSLDASSQRINPGNGRDNEADRLRGVLFYQLDPQFRVSLIGGREANNYLSEGKEAHTNRGVGLDWSPTERTQVSASREERFFGNSNSFSFFHRTAATAWKYSESKDATVQPNQQASAGLTYYDLFYPLLCLPLPTAQQQATCANNLVLIPGINVLAPAGFLSSGVSLQRRREMSFALVGVRNTVTFAVNQSESQSLSQAAGTGILAGEDFSKAQNIRQRGASLNWSHQVTALSSLTGTLSRITSTGTGGVSTLQTTQKTLNLNFTTSLGPKTSAGLAARRVVVDGTASYSENALIATANHQF